MSDIAELQPLQLADGTIVNLDILSICTLIHLFFSELGVGLQDATAIYVAAEPSRYS